MRRYLLSCLAVVLLISGCVAIPTQKIEPLAERVIGGKGSTKIVVIEISGLIIDREEKNILGGVLKPRITARVREELDKARKDRNVKALVLRINSPGGVVTACDVIHHEIKLFKKEKGVPVVAQMMDVAASGGYYVATAADSVYAHTTTVTGSIGVVAYRVDLTGLLEKIGVSDDTIKSGERKDIGSPLREMTDEERGILKDIIETMFSRFLAVVKEGRPRLTPKAVEEISDGRVFSAKRAMELGLIDGIGYMEDAVKEAKRRAGVEEATIVTYGRPASYKANIYSAVPPTVNLLNIDAASFAGALGVNFLYLWMP